ncbi:MAG: ABC transporter ATP-binding protein [Xenococcaceae cyanobacterium MO_167.B52]|nr:ABC transporter ATP-binding protein [Xenococcaceae cyanobacterium MO_167.B52]
MNSALLQVSNIHTYYEDSHVLQGVSLEVSQGEIVLLLGRHGAGKTTTLLSIMGIQAPLKGSIRFNNEEIAGLPSWEIARRGISLVPENRRLFPELTVQENLEVASKTTKKGYILETAYADFPELLDLRQRKARQLSGGQQQMLTIARSLMGNPQMLLMDEPTEGLAPIVVQRITEIVNRLISRGYTLLITGQNIAFALELANQIYIINTGQIRWGGTIKQFYSSSENALQYLAVSRFY